MSVWLTFLLSVLGTAGFLGALYAAVNVLVVASKLKATPKIGISSGDKKGELYFWIHWKPTVFSLQFFRFRLTRHSPEHRISEGQFTVTFDSPQKNPFIQPVAIPNEWINMIEKKELEKAIFTLEARTTDHLVLMKTYSLSKLQKIFEGFVKSPSISLKLKPLSEDTPEVTSLDYSELVERKQKLKNLEAQAKAKEQQAKMAAEIAAKKAASAQTSPQIQGASTTSAQPVTPNVAATPVLSQPKVSPVTQQVPPTEIKSVSNPPEDKPHKIKET